MYEVWIEAFYQPVSRGEAVLRADVWAGECCVWGVFLCLLPAVCLRFFVLLLFPPIRVWSSPVLLLFPVLFRLFVVVLLFFAAFPCFVCCWRVVYRVIP